MHVGVDLELQWVDQAFIWSLISSSARSSGSFCESDCSDVALSEPPLWAEARRRNSDGWVRDGGRRCYRHGAYEAGDTAMITPAAVRASRRNALLSGNSQLP